jgi:agmatinase
VTSRRIGDSASPSIGAVRFTDVAPAAIKDEIRRRDGERPVYVSVDIDVLDPAYAPGTGTPEAGGSRHAS